MSATGNIFPYGTLPTRLTFHGNWETRWTIEAAGAANASTSELDLGPDLCVSGSLQLIDSSAMLALMEQVAAESQPPSYLVYATGKVTQPATIEGAPSWNLNNLVADLASYSALQENWDGYNATPANQQSLADAHLFLGHWPVRAPLPKAMLAGNGEASLYWENDDAYAEISFPGDRTFHYFFDDADVSGNGDDVSLKYARLPDDLLTFVRANFV